MTSDIDPNVPATDAALASAPIRNNFTAAYNEISGIQATLSTYGNMATQSQGAVTITGGSIAGGTLNSGTVANSALAVMANNTVKGNVSGGSASPADLSKTDLTALINVFTGGFSGAVPASGGGTTNFLRADGTFAPTNSGVTSVSIAADSFFLTQSGSPITGSGTITLSDATHAARTLIGNPSNSVVAPVDIQIGPTLLFSAANLETAAFTGDVTTSTNSFVTTIANNAVTDAKMATSTANSLAGYNNSGNFSTVSVGPTLTLSGGVLGVSAGSGGTPGGNHYDVQLNNGSGGFAGSDDLNFQGGYLTINGDSGYGQLQWLNSPASSGYGGSGINGSATPIITGALNGDLSIWSSQAMNFSSDTGNTLMLQLNTDGGITVASPTGGTKGLGTINATGLYVNGVAVGTGSGTVTSVGLSSPGSTLSIGSTPVTSSGTITADIDLTHANTWTGQQTFNSSAPIIGTATASTIAGFDASKNLITLATSTYPSLTELSYVKGVTSAIQTQLNGKQASGTYVTAVTGTTNRVTSSGGTTPAIDISASYVGQSSITTLGTIGTGTWQGTKIGLAYGGTNADLSATGGSSQVLKQVSSGAAVTVGQLAFSDISGTAAAGQLPLATTGAFGAVKPDGSSITISGGVISAVGGGSGTVTTTGSPASGNLSKFSGATSITNGDLSGDITTSGTLVTTVAKIAGTAVSSTTGSTNVVFSSAPTLSNPVVGTQSTSDNSTKAASTAYVTTAIANAIAGVNPAVAVQAATTANVSGYTYNNGVSGVGATLTQNSAATVVIDGYTLLLNDRVLFKNQSTAANNGVYFISTLGTGVIPAVFTRALDYDQPSDINNTGAIPVVNGTVNATTSWLLTSSVGTVGTDSLTYTQFSVSPSTIITNSTSAGGDLTGTYPNPTIAKVQGTAVSGVTGTTNVVFSNSPTLVTPTIGAAAGTSLSLSGLTASSAVATDGSKNLVSVTNTGTGNNVLATSPTLVTPLLGTPTSGVLTNCTGTASGLTSGITNALASATTTVNVSSATAPTSGQVLTATSGTAATWQTPGGGSSNPKTLAASTTKVTHTGDTAETVIATYTMPGGTMPSTGMLFISALWSRSGATANITPRIRFGGLSGTIYGTLTMGSNANQTANTACSIYANNATNAQKGQGAVTLSTPYNNQSTALLTSAVDTTSNVDIVFTVQCTNAGDTGQLEAYNIVLTS